MAKVAGARRRDRIACLVSSVAHVVVVVALPAGGRPVALLAEIGGPAGGPEPALGLVAALAGLSLGTLALLVEPTLPLLVALHDRVAARPRIAAYLRSKRRQPFNQMGIFRHYPELDAPRPRR